MSRKELDRIDNLFQRVIVYAMMLCVLVYIMANLYHMNSTGIIAGISLMFIVSQMASVIIKEGKDDGME